MDTIMTDKTILVKGKHNEALVYAKALESSCENKIRLYLDHPAFAGTTVRIMPDVHLGKSTVIGWTATYGSLILDSKRNRALRSGTFYKVTRPLTLDEILKSISRSDKTDVSKAKILTLT